ncbi:hypothetical protein EDB19DRAFT_1706552 [Suillus lakei]|nr:hypothetical protein EDB19DRAFT_1706552 [Suillus lakei]
MISSSTVLHGTAHITITGCLAACFFKKAVFDTTHQELYDADNRLSVGAAASQFCLSTVILVLASHRTARKLLNGEFATKDDLAGDIYTHAPSKIERHKRFSMDSDTTLVADDDDYTKDFDGDSEDGDPVQRTTTIALNNPAPPTPATPSTSTTTVPSTPTQSITTPLKPPDMMCVVNRRKHQHRTHLRAARTCTFMSE